jgi:peptide/nickel transport system substrate-binding protein
MNLVQPKEAYMTTTEGMDTSQAPTACNSAKRSAWRSIAVAALVAVATAFGFTSGTQAQAVSASRTLVVAVPDDPEGLDPLRTYTFGREISSNVYSTLVTSKVDLAKNTFVSDELIGDLAESWQVAPDRSSITFKLRANATFADGSPVTAEDVVYSFERMLALRGFQSNAGGEFSRDQYELVDARTARIKFGPAGSQTAMTRWSLMNWWMGMSAIVSKKHVTSRATTDDPWGVRFMQRNPMGSGPYIVESWTPGESIILRARENYWGDVKPHYNRIEYRIVPDAEARMLLLRSGRVDIVYYPSPHQLRGIENDPALKVVSVPAAQEVVAMRMDITKPPFDDEKIREAIIKAVPYDAIIQQTIFGYGTRIKAPIGKDGYGYKEFPLYETDMKAAKDLVAASKYAGNVPSFSLVIPTRFPQRVAAAVLIQAALAEIGIDMQIRQLPYTAYWDRCQKEKYPINIHTMQPFFNDSVYWAYWMFHSQSPTNCTSFNNATLDEATKRSFVVPVEDIATNSALQKTVFDDILVGQKVMTPLYQDHWNVVAKKDITGFVYWPWLSLEYAYLRPVAR